MQQKKGHTVLLSYNSKGNINISKGNNSKKCHIQFKKKHKTKIFFNSKGNKVTTLKETKKRRT